MFSNHKNKLISAHPIYFLHFSAFLYSALERNAENRKTEMHKYRNTEIQKKKLISSSLNISQSLKMVKKQMKEKPFIMSIVEQSLHTELFYSPLVKSNL
jgi:hypothetical protein